jgi:hypothetical protein
MIREKLLCAIVGSMLACCLPAGAQEQGPWRAANTPAESITGDVAISDARMSINFASFAIARIRALDPGEVGAVFDVDTSTGGRGNLYRLSIPAEKKFLHKNTLCGSEETEWMAAFVSGRILHLAFFSGQKMPVFTMDAVSNSTDLCGTFAYTR